MLAAAVPRTSLWTDDIEEVFQSLDQDAEEHCELAYRGADEEDEDFYSDFLATCSTTDVVPGSLGDELSQLTSAAYAELRERKLISEEGEP